MSIYTEQGYENRTDYLYNLAKDSEVDFHLIAAVANTLGPNEDFDGLINIVQDISDF